MSKNYKDYINSLTLEEKASILVGYQNMKTRPIKDIPSLVMSDGPNGVRRENPDQNAIENAVRTLPATCFPSGVGLSNSWDNNLLFRVGNQIAKECRYYKINAILGPAINIKRNPLCGRNFEYLSEDPLLSGYLAANYIKGVQQNTVLACVKHYACNNLEKWRYVGSSYVDLRALNDIYLKIFEIAIREANPGMVMTSYNQINGVFASENYYTNVKILREKFNYNGLTVTDWGGMFHRDISINNGQDLEMPGMVDENIQVLIDGVKNGIVKEETLNESVLRLLNAIDITRVDDEDVPNPFESSIELATEAAVKSAVLLKNENNILPLNKRDKFAVVGDLFENMRFQGSGSALLNAYKLIDNVFSFKENNINFAYSKGYDQMNPKINKELEKAAVEMCKGFDTILFFGGLTDLSESEGFDRPNMSLDENQIHLIEELSKLNKKMVFIMYGGGPFEIPCVDSFDALLYMAMPGECGGLAATKLLFGEESPTGKLAVSWPKKYDDVPFGNEFTKDVDEYYKESIYVGYRYYSTFSKDVLYPFGYGLTYGKYRFQDLSITLNKDQIEVSYEVVNESDIELDAIGQIYVSKPVSDIPRPIKELKAYSHTHLLPREAKMVRTYIKLEDLKVYDLNSEKDLLEEGEYIIHLSEDVNTDIQTESIKLKGDKLTCPDNYKLYYELDNFINLSKEQFEGVLGYKIKEYNFKKPFTFETPICKLDSFFGRLIQKQMRRLGHKVMMDAYKIEDEKERQRCIKGGYFMEKMITSNSLRSLCYSSGGALPYKKAQGLLDLANGHPIKAIKKLK